MIVFSMSLLMAPGPMYDRVLEGSPRDWPQAPCWQACEH